ncbi:TetR/AcrR family transcriptional regulator [Nocardiopsis sp. LOL_012]|uniref:TetR/AcrR family transcriptional regulator n=1 Tax=Nocardiopsis sp. LOL_012 TaxID=3345409 RepID=UPI003A86C4CD
MSEKRRALVREQIARAAVRLFAEKGVSATTGADIADAVGISTRTLWRYFPSKEGCVRPLLTTGLDAMAEHLRSWPPGTRLIDHLEREGLFSEAPSPDERPMVALIRMTRTEPDLMAVWLQVHHEAEEVFARVFAERAGAGPDDLTVRLQAATFNAILRVASERQAGMTEESEGMGGLIRIALEKTAAGLGCLDRTVVR